MSELTREIIPIIVMYAFVLLLAPFIGFAMWMAFDGDRLRTEDAESDESTSAPVSTTPHPNVHPREPGEAFSAA